MAHFWAEIQGNRGAASRTGTKNSGIRAVVNGWHVGVSVSIRHDGEKDIVEVWKTGGSSGHKETLLAEIREEE